ncbi:MAG: exodeoxyribonuclease VII small subunit [Planctomycetota bacterium]
MAKDTTATDADLPANFEDALAEAEEILNAIEQGDVTLEESLAKFERGNRLLAHCQSVLDKAEKRIETLTKGPDGKLVAGDVE